jgi:hypothetical protein
VETLVVASNVPVVIPVERMVPNVPPTTLSWPVETLVVASNVPVVIPVERMVPNVPPTTLSWPVETLVVASNVPVVIPVLALMVAADAFVTPKFNMVKFDVVRLVILAFPTFRFSLIATPPSTTNAPVAVLELNVVD